MTNYDTTKVKVKIKKLVEHAIIPTYSRLGDACVDLYAVDCCKNLDYKYVEYGTGLSFELQPGTVGLIFPRSSISKTPHSLANAVGVLDENFRGELTLRMRYKKGMEDMEYQYGDRIGQLLIIPIPRIEFEEVVELSETNRGGGAYGSSGK